MPSILIADDNALSLVFLREAVRGFGLHAVGAADGTEALLLARQRRFDLLLLDPPTFSLARGAGFALERDYPALVARACAVVPPGGLLWLASNTRAVPLLDLVRQGLAQARREAALLAQGGLPPDHPTLPAQPEDRYLQALLLRV